MRVNAPVPLIVDTTELVTPDSAKAMLTRNRLNRPINWKKVDEYAEAMRSGRWRLHGQGIILDIDGNVITGQKRLWAVIRSGMNVYLRISRGNPKDVAALIDRGIPQSARDLAARNTGRIHSPTESSVARALLVCAGNVRPSTDALSEMLALHATALTIVMTGTRGSKKSREMLMVMAALIDRWGDDVGRWLTHIPILTDQLQAALQPRSASECWGKGVAFSLAMEHAKRLVLRDAVSGDPR